MAVMELQREVTIEESNQPALKQLLGSSIFVFDMLD
jgi:hypothetical protein